MKVEGLKNLPGIELNGKEVYDTDLAGKEQEPIVVSTKVDRATFFASKQVDNTKQFSVSNESLNPKQAFANFELTGQHFLEITEKSDQSKNFNPETVLQKYNRLKLEMGELIQQVFVLQQNPKPNDIIEQHVKGADIIRALTEMQTKLNELEQKSILQYLPNATINTSTIEVQESLTHQLQNVVETKTQENYTKYILVPTNQQQQQDYTSLLEKRIGFLEKLLTTDSSKLGQPLLHRLALLEQKTKMLDSHFLESLELRMHQIQEDYTKLHLEEQDVQSMQKIDDLYFKAEECSTFNSKVLPNIVQRLTALKQLHDENFHLRDLILQLQHQQVLIQTSLTENEELAGKLKSHMEENNNTIQQQMNQLDQRMKVILEKLK